MSFDLTGNPCTITLAQAAAGVTFVYRTRIEVGHAAITVTPLDHGGCDQPDSSGLMIREMIRGRGQFYCLCDKGRCSGPERMLDLVPGTFEGSFEWHGRYWTGPSDTGQPEGNPFPPGEYQLLVEALGWVTDELREGQLTRRPFEVVAGMRFHLVP